MLSLGLSFWLLVCLIKRNVCGTATKTDAASTLVSSFLRKNVKGNDNGKWYLAQWHSANELTIMQCFQPLVSASVIVQKLVIN